MKMKPTIYEVLAAAISHDLNDHENWFIGLATGSRTILLLSCVPLVGMALAQHTHAPNSFTLVHGWLNPVVSETPTTMESEYGNALQDWRCECRRDFLIPPCIPDRGDIDAGFGSAAQVDKYGNCNIVCIGDYRRPKIRLIGPINQPAHFSLFKREYIVLDHQKRNFVDKVDFISGVGFLDGPGSREKLGLPGSGPRLIITDKAIFDFDPVTKLARLKSIHPGTTLAQVIANTGYTHNYIPSHVPQTPLPTEKELRLIREVIDPHATLLPR